MLNQSHPWSNERGGKSAALQSVILALENMRLLSLTVALDTFRPSTWEGDLLMILPMVVLVGLPRPLNGESR